MKDHLRECYLYAHFPNDTDPGEQGLYIVECGLSHHQQEKDTGYPVDNLEVF